MRRVYGAVFILFFILASTIAGTLFVSDSYEKMVEALDNGLSFYEEADYASSQAAFSSLDALYTRRHSILQLMVHRDLLEAIGCNIKGLPAFVSANSPEDLSYSVAILKAQIFAIKRLFFSVF